MGTRAGHEIPRPPPKHSAAILLRTWYHPHANHVRTNKTLQFTDAPMEPGRVLPYVRHLAINATNHFALWWEAGSSPLPESAKLIFPGRLE